MIRPQQIKNLDNYYDVSYMLNDNITLVAILIYAQGVDASVRKIETDLISLRVDKYSQELDSILDLKIATLQDIQQLLRTDNVSKI